MTFFAAVGSTHAIAKRGTCRDDYVTVNDAMALPDAKIDGFKLDTAGLQDPALENERALASKLQSVMATGAAQGDLYGQGGE